MYNWSYLERSWPSNQYGEYDASEDSYAYSPSSKTMAYLRRRSARTMRNLAKDFPQAFAAAAADMMIGSRSTATTYELRENYDKLWKERSSQTSLMKIVEQSKSGNSVRWA